MISKIRYEYQSILPKDYDLETEYNKFLPNLENKFPDLKLL